VTLRVLSEDVPAHQKIKRSKLYDIHAYTSDVVTGLEDKSQSLGLGIETKVFELSRQSRQLVGKFVEKLLTP